MGSQTSLPSSNGTPKNSPYGGRKRRGGLKKQLLKNGESIKACATTTVHMYLIHSKP